MQARLIQLGTMQAKNLEELELQAPLLDRTLRPLVARLSGSCPASPAPRSWQSTEKRLALAGNPGDLRIADWLGIKAIGAIIGAGLFILLFFILGRAAASRSDPAASCWSSACTSGYTLPEFWLGGRMHEAPARDPAA